jgi:hypothetical protein
MRVTAHTNPDGSGQVHVHKAGCADLRKPMYHRGDPPVEDAGSDWATKTDFGLDFWSDINAEQPDENGPYTYVLDELKFFPCTSSWPKGQVPASEEAS